VAGIRGATDSQSNPIQSNQIGSAFAALPAGGGAGGAAAVYTCGGAILHRDAGVQLYEKVAVAVSVVTVVVVTVVVVVVTGVNV